MILRCYSNREEKIRFDFCPCKNTGENIAWEEWHKVEPLVVYDSDWDLLLPYFYKIFPATDPTNGEIQEKFDHCFTNWIGIEDWQEITKSIRKDISSMENKNEIQFYNQFVNWIEAQLKWADIIVIDSNL